MTFRSQLYENEKIYGDSSVEEVLDVNPDVHGRGLYPREAPFGSLPFADELDIPIIPRDEWTERIEEMERTKTRLSDLSISAQLDCKDQNGTKFCWAYGPVHAIEILRVIQGEPRVLLSPASVACKLTKFRNRGGWGTEALKYIVEHGVVPEDKWPANAIERRYDTEDAWEDAKKYRVLEWWDVEPRNLDQIFSCLFARMPCSLGFNWWSHLVVGMDPVALGNGFGLRIRNSWGMGWGDKGFSVLTGQKMLPDDVFSPRSAMPTAMGGD